MKIRLLKEQDLNHGFIECLEELGKCQTKLNEMHLIFKQRRKSGIKTFVVVEKESGKVIGTGSLILEPKFRYKEKCGHIEDVCVVSSYQGKGIGLKLLNHIINYAKNKKCYKLILSSNNHNLGFYSKLGFLSHENGLRLDLFNL